MGGGELEAIGGGVEEFNRGRSRRNWRENINIPEYLLGEASFAEYG